jgi:hypothetical protein
VGTDGVFYGERHLVLGPPAERRAEAKKRFLRDGCLDDGDAAELELRPGGLHRGKVASMRAAVHHPLQMLAERSGGGEHRGAAG